MGGATPSPPRTPAYCLTLLWLENTEKCSIDTHTQTHRYWSVCLGNKKCWFLNRLRIRSVGRFVCDLCRRLSVQHGLQLQLAKEFATSWTSFNIHARLTYAQHREGGSSQRRRGPCHHVGSAVTINCLARPQWFTAAAQHPILRIRTLARVQEVREWGREYPGRGHVYCYNSIFYSKPHLYLLL